MVADEFNPTDHAREPREEGWEEETEEIIEHIRNRGDLRIGQLLINAVSRDLEHESPAEPEKDVSEMTYEEAEEYVRQLKNHRYREKAKIEQKLWSIEADKLAELLNKGENP